VPSPACLTLRIVSAFLTPDSDSLITRSSPTPGYLTVIAGSATILPYEYVPVASNLEVGMSLAATASCECMSAICSHAPLIFFSIRVGLSELIL
jgi:hypothetical protein